jgi:adenine-specific DNA-methyltransferase
MTLEQKYKSKTDLEHRKKFAQFFTPEPIADIMADWLLGVESLNKVLEPAFGLGIFSRSLLNKKAGLEIEGFEIDETIFNEANNFFESNNSLSLSLNDYMFSNWNTKYDGIICNPPYFKFHDYDNIKVLKEVERGLNFKLNGFTNLYTLFLLKSIKQLDKGGRAAYIVPSEFLNSDYGVKVKEFLLKSKSLRHLFVFDFKENVFDDALTTAAILLLANDENENEINISVIESKSELNLIESYIQNYPNAKGQFTLSPKVLDPSIKWRKYFQLQNSIKYKNLVPFSDYAKVVRGIATGANGYFGLRPSQVNKLEIPQNNLLPCICKSKDVKGNFFTKDDLEKLKMKDETIYLFNGLGGESPGATSYIKYGEDEEIHKRYLTKKRKPWYLLENRPPAPIWVSVFNRAGVKFIRNEANISNLTTFHCVYPKPNKTINIDLLFAYLLTDIAKEIFSDDRREYGNGLNKFEPNDINKAMMLDLTKLSENGRNKILEIYDQFKSTEDSQLIEKMDNTFRNEFTISLN